MATKMKNDQPIEEQATNGSTPTQPTADLTDLQAQRKLIDDQIKRAKLLAPGHTKLERVIEKQQLLGGDYIYGSLANQVIARVQAGQARDEAFQAVMEFWTAKTVEEIDRRLRK